MNMCHVHVVACLLVVIVTTPSFKNRAWFVVLTQQTKIMYVRIRTCTCTYSYSPSIVLQYSS